MHKTRVVFLLGIVLLRGSQCIQAAPSCQASYIDLPIKPIFIHKQILPKINPQPTLRYASGMQGLSLSAGMTSLGYEALLAWSYHCSPVLQIKSYVGLQWQNRKHSRFKNIFLQPQIGYTIFSNDAYLYLNILAGPVFSYNYYQEQKLADVKSNFNVGVKLGGETELFLVKNIEVLIGPIENVLFSLEMHNLVEEVAHLNKTIEAYLSNPTRDKGYDKLIQLKIAVATKRACYESKIDDIEKSLNMDVQVLASYLPVHIGEVLQKLSGLELPKLTANLENLEKEENEWNDVFEEIGNKLRLDSKNIDAIINRIYTRDSDNDLLIHKVSKHSAVSKEAYQFIAGKTLDLNSINGNHLTALQVLFT